MFNLLKNTMVSMLDENMDKFSTSDARRYLTALKWASIAYTNATDQDVGFPAAGVEKEIGDISPSLTDAVEALPAFHEIIDQTGNTNTRIIVESKPDMNGTIHIACRGTTSELDWRTNLNFGMTPFTNFNQVSEQAAQMNHATLKSSFVSPQQKICPMVHTGFYHALLSVLPDVLNALSTAINKNTQSQKRCDNEIEVAAEEETTIPLKQIHISGHSLGGGLACLLGYALVSSRDIPGNDYLQVNVVTFGAPHVGDSLFAALVTSSDRLTIERLVLSHDPVPRLLSQSHQSNRSIVRPYVHIPLKPIILDSTSESFDRVATCAAQAYHSATDIATEEADATYTTNNNEERKYSALWGVLSAATAAASSLISDHSLATYWKICSILASAEDTSLVPTT